jgi:hypothetical protein
MDEWYDYRSMYGEVYGAAGCEVGLRSGAFPRTRLGSYYGIERERVGQRCSEVGGGGGGS